ncbi:hypothetical protein JYU34_012580 [Plutella xylostella]|uniref:Uncharacterized protein n=1 Tax=Plutella xylostella TaxID=51655 RepID=A0ABQ7QFB4_PLUXY|nr:hypothetical protein JYU34_012580 [Plutella xylostella]
MLTIFGATMDTESSAVIDQILNKHVKSPRSRDAEGSRVQLRALLVALLGVSMSACALASQPVELELDDDDVAQKLGNVSFARRLTKPTIRFIMGYGKLSAFATAATSLLLLVAVMSKVAVVVPPRGAVAGGACAPGGCLGGDLGRGRRAPGCRPARRRLPRARRAPDRGRGSHDHR